MRIPNIEEIAFNKLPDSLKGWEEAIRVKIRLGYLAINDKGVAPAGSTKMTGHPDVPVDLAIEFPASSNFNRSWHDCEVPIAQVNLGELPDNVLPRGCPHTGMLWVFLDLSNEAWKARCLYDLREPSEMTFIPAELPGQAMRFQPAQTLPWATKTLFPEFYWNETERDAYNDFAARASRHGDGYTCIFGGWNLPVQSDFEESAKTFIAAFPNLEFGDCGVVYLHFINDEFVAYATCA